MSSIKVEPTEGESPLTVHPPPPLPITESTPQSTVKCEWSLAGVCVCADGQCEDCQASEKEDEKEDIRLTMTPAAASPRNEPDLFPPEWEDCKAEEDTGTTGDEASEDVKPVFGPVDDNAGEQGPIIEQVNPPEEIKEESTDNVEDVEANEEAEMVVEEASQVTVNVASVSFLALPRSSTRARANYQVNGQAVEEMMAESETETKSHHEPSLLQQENPKQRNQQVIANNEGSVSTEPDEAGQAEATAVSSLSLRRSPRVRKRPVNYALLPEAEEEETPQDEADTVTGGESETETEMETDEPNETGGSYPIAANDSDRRLSRSSFSCGHCKKEFSSKRNARRHEDTLHHQIVRPRPYVCSVADCGKAFDCQFDLDRHSMIHSGLRPFTCATCGASFNRKTNLIAHQRRHTTERPYACSVCPKAFKFKSNLVQHTLLHSQVKPTFTCVDCGSSFTQKGNLEQHRQGKIPCASRYAPSESRPFSCTVAGCRRAFKRRDNLNAHLGTHSGAKEFKCTVCKGTFTCRASLKRHSRKLHGI